MKPAIILFITALLATGTWFVSLGKARTTTLGPQADITDALIYVLITGATSFLGDMAVRAYVPVLLLKRQVRLLKRRIKKEERHVNENQQFLITREKQGFWHDDITARRIAEHRIARDHAIAERPPSAT